MTSTLLFAYGSWVKWPRILQMLAARLGFSLKILSRSRGRLYIIPNNFFSRVFDRESRSRASLSFLLGRDSTSSSSSVWSIFYCIQDDWRAGSSIADEKVMSRLSMYKQTSGERDFPMVWRLVKSSSGLAVLLTSRQLIHRRLFQVVKNLIHVHAGWKQWKHVRVLLILLWWGL